MSGTTELMLRTGRFLKYLPAILWVYLESILQWLVPQSLLAKDVASDVVLITGAGSGLGREIALEYAKLGSSLVLWDINQAGLQETKQLAEDQYSRQCKQSIERDADDKSIPNIVGHQQSSGTRWFCLTYQVDVTNRAQVNLMADKVQLDINGGGLPQHDGRERYVSVLVNNAGIYHGLLLQDLSDEQIERVFKVNIMSHFWTVRAFLPQMIGNQRGHIVEIASMGGISGMFKQVDYCSTKFAAVGFEESLSIELNHLGLDDKIRTTVICPLFFQSNLFTGFNSKAASIMSSGYVARQTVMAMRCNYHRALLPTFSAYSMYLFRCLTPRRAMFLIIKALGLDEGVKDIRGHAAAGAAPVKGTEAPPPSAAN